MYEDTIIPFLIIPICKKIRIIPNCFYGYRLNKNGIVNKSKTSDDCYDTIYILDDILNLMKDNEISFNYNTYIFLLNIHFAYVTYERIKYMSIENRKKMFITMCLFVKKLNIRLNSKVNILTINMEKSFLNRNFELWELTSKMLSYCH